MNVMDVVFFYLCKGIIHPIKIFKKYIVKIKNVWVNKITIVASQHVCYSCINYMEMEKTSTYFKEKIMTLASSTLYIEGGPWDKS